MFANGRFANLNCHVYNVDVVLSYCYQVQERNQEKYHTNKEQGNVDLLAFWDIFIISIGFI
jgi:hypothetical protein